MSDFESGRLVVFGSLSETVIVPGGIIGGAKTGVGVEFSCVRVGVTTISPGIISAIRSHPLIKAVSASARIASVPMRSNRGIGSQGSWRVSAVPADFAFYVKVRSVDHRLTSVLPHL